MEKSQTKSKQTLRITQTGVLIALLIVMAFTPLGYLKTGAIEISFMMIPVVIGAAVLGPGVGALLGGVFGITSFIQCFGQSAFGALLLSLNPVFTFLVCMVPRTLAGFLAGLVFKALKAFDKTKLLSFAATALSGALLNTVLFIAFLYLFFWHSGTFTDTMADWALPVSNFGKFAIAFVGVNGAVEAAVCFGIGTALSKVLAYFTDK